MVTVAYVVGCGHSGTTLLQRVLGAHSQAVGVGGVRHLQRALRGEVGCSCEAPDLFACPFWGDVDEVLRASGAGLQDLDPNTDDPDRFVHDNGVLLAAVADATGASVVVDPSRRVDRLRGLQGVPGLRVVPIHVFKDPRAQFSSHKRKGRSGVRGMRSYCEVNLAALVAARRFPVRIRVSYEDFCRHPGTLVPQVLETLGLAAEPELLSTWGEVPVHALEGNRMLRNPSSEIRLDRSWQHRMNRWERAWALATGSVVHRMCTAGSLKP